jgi:hypothetical protein
LLSSAAARGPTSGNRQPLAVTPAGQGAQRTLPHDRGREHRLPGRDHVRFKSPEYLQLKAAGDLAAVQAKLDTPVLIMGDFNDEPSDASVIGHLQNGA